MSREYRRPDSESRHVGTLFVATLVGVGVGLLSAPQPGHKTRRALGKRLAALRENVSGELEELSPKARRALRELAERRRRRNAEREALELDALAELEDEDLEADDDDLDEDDDEDEDDDSDGGGVGRLLSIAAGLAAGAYFLTSDRAGPARERVISAAATIRDEAEERWEQLQRWRAARTTSNGGTQASSEPGPMSS